mmetsp:Transcript_50343/g.126364  ORF Transcript_50343/g.126364 Transcript_50343/m.126364 type:complete len:210 (+) Transcript_50343:1005-1634(+)
MRPVSFLRTCITLPKLPRPTTFNKSKSSMPTFLPSGVRSILTRMSPVTSWDGRTAANFIDSSSGWLYRRAASFWLTWPRNVPQLAESTAHRLITTRDWPRLVMSKVKVSFQSTTPFAGLFVLVFTCCFSMVMMLYTPLISPSGTVTSRAHLICKHSVPLVPLLRSSALSSFWSFSVSWSFSSATDGWGVPAVPVFSLNSFTSLLMLLIQ